MRVKVTEAMWAYLLEEPWLEDLVCRHTKRYIEVDMPRVMIARLNRVIADRATWGVKGVEVFRQLRRRIADQVSPYGTSDGPLVRLEA